MEKKVKPKKKGYRDRHESTRWQTLNEERIYELLGVKIFRKLVFLLEKCIHKGSDRKNVNYHLASRDPGALDRFIKFLFYNGSIHVRNVIYAAIYFLVRLCLIHFTDYTPKPLSRAIDVFIVILLIKDIYCIMLQRYNYLRIRKRQEKLEEMRQRSIKKQSELHIKSFSEHYDSSYTDVDLNVIRGMKEKIAKGELVFISDRDLETLRRINDAMSSHIM